MPQTESSPRKLKVIRVVTASYVVPWHLANTLMRMPADFETYVVGQGVSGYRDMYPGVYWIDLELERKVAGFADLRALFALCRIFSTVKPDIVHSIMPKAGLLTAIAGVLCRVPVRLHTFTGQVWVARSGFSARMFYWLDRLINMLNTLCMTDSPSQSRFLFDHGFRKGGRELPVLSKGSLSGVSERYFEVQRRDSPAENLRERLHIRGHFTFSFIARKTVAKGAVDILRAFQRLYADHKEAKLLFVGPDEENSILHLKETTPELFDGVIDLPGVDNLEPYLAVTDVLCLPSYREGFGSIVIDAAAVGVPAIGSRIPGLVDAIEDGVSGMLCPAGDVQSLAACMEAMLLEPERCRKMGEQARSRARQLFGADVLYQALRSQYLDLAKDKGLLAEDRGR